MSDLKSIVETQMTASVVVLQDWAKKFSRDKFLSVERNITLILSVCGGAYLLATIFSGLIMNSMMSSILTSRTVLGSKEQNSLKNETQMIRSPSNSREFAKAIRERNLFNSEGKFPEEKLGDRKEGAGAVFDIDSPCRPTTLGIELLGTIYLGDRFKSIATVRDKTYSVADVYRVGDEIYGSEGAKVTAVDRQSLIINNGGVKECIELNKPMLNQTSDGFPSVGGNDFGSSQPVGGGTGAEVVLESSYVESELGPGFAKIMDAARFVPNTVDGAVNGFKIFSIKPGTLLSKIGLQNNDVITQVNDTSLKQADQGFAFYQAMQDEKEVRIQLLRGGSTPTNITVRIK